MSQGVYGSVYGGPAASDLRDGVTFGAVVGTAAIPTASQVLNGVPVDATVGNVVLPATSDVRAGVEYGVGGAGSEGAAVIPAPEDVLEGVDVDDGEGTLSLVQSPLLAIENGEPYARRDIIATINSAQVHRWKIVDGSRAPLNLAAKVVRFICAEVGEATQTGLFNYNSNGGSPRVAISGTDSNVVTVTLQASDTVTVGVGRFAYWLWNITDDYPIAGGLFTIAPSAKAVP